MECSCLCSSGDHDIPPINPPTEHWDVSFPDESYEIASECQGGLSRYSALGIDVDIIANEEPLFKFSHTATQVPTRALFGNRQLLC